MAWTSLPTYTNGVLTAAMMNAIKDNINETAPAKAIVGSWPLHFTSSATNTVAAREIRDHTVSDQDSTANTAYVDLPSIGPIVTVTTGAFALVFPASRVFNTAGGVSYASFLVEGATVGDVVADGRGVANQGTDDLRAASVQLMATTPGSNVFQMKYRVSSATGTYQSRRLCVMGL